MVRAYIMELMCLHIMESHKSIPSNRCRHKSHTKMQTQQATFKSCWSTSRKADKSLHYFTEVLPFSAWPAHLIFLYITLTSTGVFIQILPVCCKGNIWKHCWKFNLSTFNFGSYSVKNRDGAETADEMMSTNKDYRYGHSFPEHHSLHEARALQKKMMPDNIIFQFL